jgi:acetyltransferase-like isoleucine patch superfamily enzyme
MRNYDMKFVAIDFGQDPKPKLFPLGITIHNLRGVRHFSENTAFEPPCHSHAEIHNWCEVRIGAFSHFNAGRIGDVHIGRYSAVGADVVIGMHEHPTDWLSTSRLMYQPELHDFRITAGAHDLQALQSKKRTFTEFSKVTTIGNDVLVGQGVYFKGGVTVGDGAVIGARSVVVKDVPPYAIVAGSPAKVKRYRFPDQIIERLLALKWWRFSLFDFYGLPFDNIEAALDAIEDLVARGVVQEYQPKIIGTRELKALLENGTPIPVKGAGAHQPIKVRNVEGYVDRIDGRQVSGWAYDKTRPDLALDVEIHYGGQRVAVVRADRLRQDLASAGKGNGRHAFVAILAAPVSRNEVDSIDAFARCGNAGDLVPLVSRPRQHRPAAPNAARP